MEQNRITLHDVNKLLQKLDQYINDGQCLENEGGAAA